MPDVIVWDTTPTSLPNRALDINEVAAYIHCSRRTVHREIVRKKLRAFKVGADWRVMPEDLLAYTRGEVA